MKNGTLPKGIGDLQSAVFVQNCTDISAPPLHLELEIVLRLRTRKGGPGTSKKGVAWVSPMRGKYRLTAVFDFRHLHLSPGPVLRLRLQPIPAYLSSKNYNVLAFYYSGYLSDVDKLFGAPFLGSFLTAPCPLFCLSSTLRDMPVTVWPSLP